MTASTARAPTGPRIVASFRLATAPQAIAVGAGGVWVTTVQTLVRIDPRTNAIAQRRRLKPVLGAATTTGRELWLARNPIRAGANPAVPSELWSVDAGGGGLRGPPIRFQLIADVATAAGAIWVTNGDHARYGRLFEVDPRRRAIVRGVEIPGAPSGIVRAAGLLWVAASDTGLLFRVDPRTARRVGQPVRAGKALLTIAAGPGRIWVGDSYAGAVDSVDARTARVVTRTTLRHVSGVAVGGGAVWATVDRPSELVRLDPRSGARVGRPLPVPHTASGLAVGFGSIWLLTANGVLRVRP